MDDHDVLLAPHILRRPPPRGPAHAAVGERQVPSRVHRGVHHQRRAVALLRTAHGLGGSGELSS
jgi:hypothetical protein